MIDRYRASLPRTRPRAHPGLLLLVIGERDIQAVGPIIQRTRELLVRQDRCALQRLEEIGALDRESLLVIGRHHPRVIRELAVDDLGGQHHATEGKTHQAAEDLDRYRLVAVREQAPQFQHGFARQYDLAFLLLLAQRPRSKAQPVAVGGTTRTWPPSPAAAARHGNAYVLLGMAYCTSTAAPVKQPFCGIEDLG